MDDFVATYEKLLNMGFLPDDVHLAIEKGYFNFKGIFNYLVNNETRVSTKNDSNPQNLIEYRATLSGISEIMKDNFSKVTVTDDLFNENPTEQNTLRSSNDKKLEKVSYSSIKNHKNEMDNDDTFTFITKNSDEPILNKIKNFDKKSKITNDFKLLSMQMSSCFKQSLSNQDYINIKTVVLQIMDLLDPSQLPITYTQSFLVNLCTVRDVISWFHKVRSINVSNKNYKTKFSGDLASLLSLDKFIDLFRNHKWHFVSPRFKNDILKIKHNQLDEFLIDLGLDSKVHLLASKNFDKLDDKTEVFSNNNMRNDNHSQTITEDNHSQTITENNHLLDRFQVQIQMIDYQENPIYTIEKENFHHYYNFNSTTLHQLLMDYKLSYNKDNCVPCHTNKQIQLIYPDCGNYQLVNEINRKLSQVNLYHQLTLSDVGLCGDTTLFCQYIVTELPASNIKSDLKEINSKSLINPLKSPPKLITKSVNRLTQICFDKLLQLIEINENVLLKMTNIHQLDSEHQQIILKNLITNGKLKSGILSNFCHFSSKLTSLDLSFCDLVSNDILKSIGRCYQIKELVLDTNEVNQQLSNEGLWYLRGCVQLQRLSLNHCTAINDWGLQVVTELTNLNSLSIRGTSVTNVGLRHLHLRMNSSIKITFLDLGSLCLTDDCLECLTTTFPELETLLLSNTFISDPAKFPLFPKLRHLDLSNCSDLRFNNQVHIRSIAAAFPRLTSIALNGINDDSLMHATLAISRCHHLHREDGLLIHHQMTESLANTLCHLPLHTINLSHCPHITDSWLPLFSRLAPSLSHLVLSHCHNITGSNNSLLTNMTKLTKLVFLDLSHLEAVDPNQFISLFTNNYFPNLKIVWISLSKYYENILRSKSAQVLFKINVTRSNNN